ncbi:Ferric siderophore transport system, periplasmic binding protein TonB [Sphingobium indicum BiD32]|uniref:Protein TonB n=1 Tax=Sphingobium indicum BiD32 TaxID=1301087 RepID=N1MIT7_9SPHN|nr:energy transducer TonB [Sphingobium indicum]CCW16871.1 Ferric siderophore transport system, periplasmic binding protein TonB [Sphingobium indicum BiD32]
MRMSMMQAAMGRGMTERRPDAPAPSGYRRNSGSPVGIGGAIAVHALVIGAWLLIPKEVIDTVFTPPPLTTTNIPLADPPPPEPVEQTVKKPIKTRPTQQRPTVTDPIVPGAQGDPVITGGAGTGDAIDPGPTIILPPLDPPRAPVLVDAGIDPRALGQFQPDYPGAMIRQGLEGTVTVRVTINAEGRVTDIARVAASDESFWLATQRHALRKWRFRPATRDGVPVATTKILTVRFTLTER